LRVAHPACTIPDDDPGRPDGGRATGLPRSPLGEEINMARKYIDCRLFPSDTKCSVAISADTEDEVVDAAVQHAASVHKHEDSPQLRKQLRACVKEGNPAA
jgi:predicted small metal-binding protein